MRFFSNDARETPDDEETHDGRPERVTSDPVAVPVQRPASSPWAATPAAAAPVPAADRDTGRPGDTPVAGRPPFHEPAPQPTAFGAGTVGGAVAASALANPVHDTRDDTDRRTDTTPAVAEPAADGPQPSSFSTAPTAFPPARSEASVPRSEASVPRSDASVPQSEADRFDRTDVDLTDFDRPAGDRRDDDQTDLDLDRTGTDRADTDRAEIDRADLDGSEVEGSGRGSTTPAEAEPIVVGPDSHDGEPAGALPGTVAAPELGPLFADRDSHVFRDRWRDVQLRFVDDPKAAADEAAGLVDEVVEALSASLKRQREQITGDTAGQDSGDTEQLRVRLRSYRDFLDHLLGL